MKNTKIIVGAFMLVALFSLNSFAAQETQNVKQIAPNIILNQEELKSLELAITKEKESQEKEDLAESEQKVVILNPGESYNISSVNQTIKVKLPSDIQNFKPISNKYSSGSITFNSSATFNSGAPSYVTIEVHRPWYHFLAGGIYTMSVTFEKTTSNYNIILTVAYGVGNQGGYYSGSENHKIGTIARKK